MYPSLSKACADTQKSVFPTRTRVRTSPEVLSVNSNQGYVPVFIKCQHVMVIDRFWTVMPGISGGRGKLAIQSPNTQSASMGQWAGTIGICPALTFHCSGHTTEIQITLTPPNGTWFSMLCCLPERGVRPLFKSYLFFYVIFLFCYYAKKGVSGLLPGLYHSYEGYPVHD